jgi:hypothetical protein
MREKINKGLRAATIMLEMFVLCAVFTGTLGAQSSQDQPIYYVDANAAPGGNGSLQQPFQGISDALARSHLNHGHTLIRVRPGTYSVSNTLILEDDSVSLLGSDLLETDSGGLPTGIVMPGTETVLTPALSLGSMPLIAIGQPSGSVVRNVTIQGFTLTPQSGNAIDLLRAQEFTVAGNIIKGPQSNFGINAQASSGVIAGNYVEKFTCGTCATAGYEGSPAVVQIIGNRIVQNRNAALILTGSTVLDVPGVPSIPEPGDQMHAIVRNNDLSMNSSSTVGFGIRVFMIRREFPDAQSSGDVQALIQDNRIDRNYIGISIDAGFPFRQIGTGAAKVCDTRVYGGRFHLNLLGNQITNSLRSPGVISFTRLSATLNPAQRPQWQYLHNADFTIVDPQEELAGSIVDNPALDPFVDNFCAADKTQEALGNSLRYNGGLVRATP